MVPDKRQALVEVLLRSPVPMSGEELASRLGVSSRTVRNYVRELNRPWQLISTSHRGYAIDHSAYAAHAGAEGAKTPPNTPQSRLQHIARMLAQSNEPISVFDLAEHFWVSESTIEADLSRARDLFRQHDLVLRRDRDCVRVVGAERSRRRLVRQLLQNVTQSLLPTAWRALEAEYTHIDLPSLRAAVTAAVQASDLVLNEFALSDVIVHLTITVDRVRAGHPLPLPEWSTDDTEPAVLALCRSLAESMADKFDVVLPESELQALYGVIAVRGVRSGAASKVVDPHIRAMVAEFMDDVSAEYLLGPADPAMQLNLALHVQNTILRVRSGLSLVRPFGETFKNDHPLIHEMAVYFAQKVEVRSGIVMGPGEVDYLSMHMGMQYMRYLEQRDVVSVTLVAPQYYDMADGLSEQLSRKLAGQAVVETVASAMDIEWGAISSDLVVSCVKPLEPVAAPVLLISPFLTAQDLDAVLSAVRQERLRNANRRVRMILSTLIDPSLFVRVPSISTKEDAIALLCERLETAGFTEPTFLADVLDRERRSSTCFGGQFAIPHSMHMDANATALAVLASDKGIPWGSGTVRLVLLFALSPDARQTFRDALDHLIHVLSDTSRINEIIEASTDVQAFVAALQDQLDD